MVQPDLQASYPPILRLPDSTVTSVCSQIASVHGHWPFWVGHVLPPKKFLNPFSLTIFLPIWVEIDHVHGRNVMMQSRKGV